MQLPKKGNCYFKVVLAMHRGYPFRYICWFKDQTNVSPSTCFSVICGKVSCGGSKIDPSQCDAYKGCPLPLGEDALPAF